MAFINVAEWTPENVSHWLQGLEDCILPYVHFFLNNQINGCRLLLLNSDDLHKLNVTKIGHQEIILDGVDLLKHLHYNFNSETLQSLALRLGCKSRSLYNQLKQEQAQRFNIENKQISDGNSSTNLNSSKQLTNYSNTKENHKESKDSKNSSKNNSSNQNNLNSSSSNLSSKSSSSKVSTKTLFAVCDILNAAKTFISWIDRYPFEGQEVYVPIRKTILKLSIELASTAQRDQFVDSPNDIILTSCLTFAGLCDRIVQDLHDSLAIQPASLDVALIKKRSNEELGMHIHSSYSGIHIISGIKLSSATNNCGRIDEGDEIVQVNYRTVVGWQLRKLVDIMKEYQTELILTLKKRPKHIISNSQANLNKPFKLPIKEYTSSQSGKQQLEQQQQSSTSDSEKSMTLKPKSNVSQKKDNIYINTNNSSEQHHENQSKCKATIKRRATISGSSSSVKNFGLALSIGKHKNSIQIQNEAHQKKLKIPFETNASNDVPYAKVQPLQSNVEKTNGDNKQTIPKQLSTFTMTTSSNGKTIATIKSENVNIVLPSTSNKQQIESTQLKLTTFQAEINTQQIESTEIISSGLPPPVSKPPPPPPSRRSISSVSYPITSKPAVPIRPSITAKPTNNTVQNLNEINKIQLNRFVTLKQIEEENASFFKQNPSSSLCQLFNNSNSSTNNNKIDNSVEKECNNLLSGWLYTKREHFNTLLNTNAKWTAKYVQLTTNYQLYAFRNEHAVKADLVINLAAFKISPACECKSKENVFKTFNKHVIFLFSCESQNQMRLWVDTLRQLVANCASTKPELMKLSSSTEIACYSETEDEEDVMDDEMMMQNFANELVETSEQMNQHEIIETKLDLSKNDGEKQEDSIKIVTENQSTPVKNEEIEKEENEEDEKHNKRMQRLLNRRRQHYSTPESYRESSPSSTTSSASSSANNSASQAVLNRFAAISELRERLQKQAQEKLDQRKLALSNGKIFNRSSSCMEPSLISNLREKLQSNTTNNTSSKQNLVRNRLSGSQQSLSNSISNQTLDLSSEKSLNSTLNKPVFMTKHNKVLPNIPQLPPRPPKPASIQLAQNKQVVPIVTNTVQTQKSDKNENLVDPSLELNNKSQPLPQPRVSKTVLQEEEINDKKNNLNVNTNKAKQKTVQENQQNLIQNHKDNEYISNIIDQLYNFTEEADDHDGVINKPIPSEISQSQINILNQQLNVNPIILNNVNNTQPINFQLNNSSITPLMGCIPAMQFGQMSNAQISNHQMMINSRSDQFDLLQDNELDDLDDEEFLDEDDEEDEEYLDDEEEENQLNKDLNAHLFNNVPKKVKNQFNGPSLSFGYNTESNIKDINGLDTTSKDTLGFLAPGPNFLNFTPENKQSFVNHQENHLGSSSNSNKYPSLSSSNSYNISPLSSISQHQQNGSSPTAQQANLFNNQLNQLNNQFSQFCNINGDEQLSDSSSGVSSYYSAMTDLQSAEYFKVLQVLQQHQQQLQGLPPELQQQYAQQFTEQFQQHFQYQLQLQLQQQILQQKQQQQQQQTNFHQNQFFHGQAVPLGNNDLINPNNNFFNQLLDSEHNQHTNDGLFRNGSSSRMTTVSTDDGLEKTASESSLSSNESLDEEDCEELQGCSSNSSIGSMSNVKKSDKKTGRKSSFRLFGSPKLLKKLTTLKHQKEKRIVDTHTARNALDSDGSLNVWISMTERNMLEQYDEMEVNHNLNDKVAIDNGNQQLDKSPKEMSKFCEKSNEALQTKDNSLNSSQSSFVQLSTNETSASNVSNKIPGSSLANKLFGRNKNNHENKSSNGKSLPTKNAPQITQVIYKRKMNIPKLLGSEKQSNELNQKKISKESNQKEELNQLSKSSKESTNTKEFNSEIISTKSKMITVPDEEDDEDDPIYAEINETQLVLEEMRQCLNQHSTERKIIDMMLQKPPKSNNMADQLTVN